MFRQEYPRPQMVRPDWINLNGTWEFEIDRSDSGIHRELWKKDVREVEGTAPASTI